VLQEAGLIRRAKDGVRLLGHGELTSKLAFEVTALRQRDQGGRGQSGGHAEIHHRPGSSCRDAIKAKRRADKRVAASCQVRT